MEKTSKGDHQDLHALRECQVYESWEDHIDVEVCSDIKSAYV